MVRKIGIDLGTTNLLICLDNKGVIVNEPSVITVDATSKKCIAAGIDARDMLGRTPKNMICIRPLKDGVVADFEATDMMLNYFLKKCELKGMFKKNVILICHPTKITSVEKNAIRDCAYRAGAKKVYLEEEPKVAAIGAGLDIGKPSGHMVLDMGGGTSDIAVLSLGDIVCSTSIKVAGNKLTNDIIEGIRVNKKMYIGEQSADEIKIRVGNALHSNRPEKMTISGRDVETGLPHSIEINSNEVESYIRNSLQEIVHATRTILEVTPPELAADIVQHGLVLTGGGALLKNLDQLLKDELKIPVYVAENALNCVVDGCNIMLKSL
ncbi:rod shape-determining protein [Amedibacillus dolichus]|uniref:Cell shape-determining protein MreB n=1 Tax=Amedibacillus dolichus DSM 3991 TaxID=428127 RepID=A8R951_9FIRM|nr:rod shape-determining protein [Amedibacillus dolichus]EDP11928.1 Mbl protein [Amedibacillus dolichus DSM 3991]